MEGQIEKPQQLTKIIKNWSLDGMVLVADNLKNNKNNFKLFMT